MRRQIDLWPKRPLNARGPCPRPVMDRFMEKFTPEPNSGCWLWTAALNNLGYSVIGVGSAYDGTRRTALAHAVAWELFLGGLPEHLDLDHKCRVPSCVNPDHLELVTHRENICRGKNSSLRSEGKWKRQTHCQRGHPLSGTNLYVPPDGTRNCRACRRFANKQYLERTKS